MTERPGTDPHPAPVLRRIVSGMLAGWLQAAVGVVVSVVQVRLVFTHLDPDLTGAWFLFLTLAGYVALFDLGISPTLSRQVSFALGEADEGESRQKIADLVATTVRIFGWISAGVLAVSIVAGLWFLSDVVPPVHRQPVRAAWAVFAVGAALSVFGNTGFAALNGLGRVGTERTVRAAVQLAHLGLMYAALATGTGLLGLSMAFVANGLLLSGSGWVVLERTCPWLRGLRGSSAGILRAHALASGRWALTALGSVLILGTDNLVIARVMGAAAIPPYELVAKLTAMSMFVASQLVTSAAPFVSVAQARGDEAGIRRLMLRTVRYGMAVMMGLSAGILVFAEPFIRFWVGPGHFVGFSVVAVFVAMMSLEAHHRFHATISMAMGRVVFHWWALGSGVLNLVLTLVLIRSHGLLGVALGSLLAQLVTNNWFVPFYTLRLLGLSIARYVVSVALPLVVLFGAAAGAGFAVRAVMPPGTPLLAQLSAGAGAVLTTSAVVFYALLADEPERREIGHRIQRALHPRNARA